MPERLTIQINDYDNVAVAVHDLPAGTKLEGGLVTRDPIPQAHKISRRSSGLRKTIDRFNSLDHLN